MTLLARGVRPGLGWWGVCSRCAWRVVRTQELSSRDQQDLMWEKGSVSVWDLEQIEEQAESEGKVTVWSDEGQRSIAQEEEMRRNALLRDQQGN